MSSRAPNSSFDRAELESLLKRRFFYGPAFEIYGGPAGLFDYGPAGCALQANIVDFWRRHFVLEEDMLEVDCTMLTPAQVLKVSGHVDKFSDWMCKDPKTGEIFRADHLVEQVLEDRLKRHQLAIGQQSTNQEEDKKKKKLKIKSGAILELAEETVQEYKEILAKIDNYDGKELGELMRKHVIKNPATDGPLESPVAFNLMFSTTIGPSAQAQGYLRPETAQGQFLNFSKLLQYNNQKMPFASASIGKSFRNEISPRSGLLRVREFLMAEIEHYVDPTKKDHPRFDEVKDFKCQFLPKGVQQAGKNDLVIATIGDAVQRGMVDNRTLGYFLGRIWLFLTKIGCNMNRVRFRQHMENEMAHYASDCWDAELHTSYGWIECIGCADRSAYDLSVHQKATGQSLSVQEALEKPVIREVWEAKLDMKALGPILKQDLKEISAKLLDGCDQTELESYAKLLKDTKKLSLTTEKGKNIEIQDKYIALDKVEKKETTREYIPNVIEPSFGIGRILYSLMEHVYWPRPDDANRGVLSFPALVAPTKCLLVPLSSNDAFVPIVKDLSAKLRQHGISSKVDDSSSSIGKRYARNDELGTPFGITVDFQTVKDGTITLRERDSTKQVRAGQEEVFQIIKDIIDEKISWPTVLEKYGESSGQVID